MGDLSPAAELRAAAARLRERAEALPFVATLKPAVGAYLAAMRPDVALAFADWLEREAALIDAQVFPQSDPVMERYPLAAARAVLAREAEAPDG